MQTQWDCVRRFGTSGLWGALLALPHTGPPWRARIARPAPLTPPLPPLQEAWAVLGQTIAPVQVVGALVVVGAVMALGLRKG